MKHCPIDAIKVGREPEVIGVLLWIIRPKKAFRYGISWFFLALLLSRIINMFALGSNSRQRPQSQSHSHYRPQEYYLPTALPSHLPLPFQDSNGYPRPFAGEHIHADLHPPSEHSSHLYHNNEGGLYDNKESLSPNVTLNHSYNRCASSSSDSHVSPHIPYLNHQQLDPGRFDLAGPHLKTPNVLDNISLAPYHQSFSPEQHSAPIGSVSEHSGDSELWSVGAQASSPEHSKPRKTRCKKPRIELAPDQPPTTQGKPRARVYVACLQWFVLSISKIYYSS